MKHKGNIILLAVVLLLFYSCQKKTNQSPVATMSANVGGQMMSFNPSISDNTNGINITGGSIQTSALNEIEFYAIKILPGYLGTYKINASAGGGYSAGLGAHGYVQTSYSTNKNDTGVVIITGYDSQNNTISGTFSFIAGENYPDSAKSTINITTGVFANLKL